MKRDNPAADPFIYTPRDRAPRATRTVHGVLTLMAWAIYAYLWLPLLTVLAWMLGIRTAFVELYVRHNRVEHSIFVALAVLAVVTTLLIVGWAEYNRQKFGGHDRRTAPDHVDADEVAEALAAPKDIHAQLLHAKSATLKLSKDARLIGIDRHTPSAG